MTADYMHAHLLNFCNVFRHSFLGNLLNTKPY